LLFSTYLKSVKFKSCLKKAEFFTSISFPEMSNPIL
jgi:hypothetical protein